METVCGVLTNKKGCTHSQRRYPFHYLRPAEYGQQRNFKVSGSRFYVPVVPLGGGLQSAWLGMFSHVLGLFPGISGSDIGKRGCV